MPVMAPSGEDRSVPLLAFNFHVSFNLPAFAKVDKPLLGGFSDVTGLEASMEARAIPAVNSGRRERDSPPRSSKLYISLETISVVSPIERANTSVFSNTGISARRKR